MAYRGDSPMRILFLTSTFPRFPGDMQANFVGEQATAWKAARPKDEIVILAPHDALAARREALDGIEVVRFRYVLPAKFQGLAYPAILPNLKRRPLLAAQIPSFLVSQYLAARKLVKSRPIDLIYAHWVMPQGLVAMWLNRTIGVPYVLQNHSSDLRVFGKMGRRGHGLARRIINSAQHLFCVNSAQREYSLSLFAEPEKRAVGPKVTVLPMGVNPPDAGAAGSIRYEFASISRLSKKKGLHHFIAAAEKLAAHGFRPSIGIAGNGEDADELKAMVQHADIHFPGFLTGPEKDALFDQTRTFVMPSIASGDDVEGMPVSLLEALCRGKPTIAGRDTNIASLPEWSSIKDDVIYLEDPSDLDAFGTAMRKVGDVLDGDAESRLRTVMARYWWPNLIHEYLDALGSKPENAP